MINADEIAGILKQQIEGFKSELQEDEIGTVIKVGANLARVYGLRAVRSSELVEFPNGLQGVALNLEEDNVGVVIMGPDKDIKEGDKVRRTGRIASVPVGEALLGRVVNPLGEPIDGKGPIETHRYRTIENIAPSVVQRQPVKQPLQTGIRAIDALIPIGRGQRELIIGDRSTGKTAIAIDTIINQKGRGVLLHLRRDRAEELDGRSAPSSPRAEGRDGLHDNRLRRAVRSGRAALDSAVCRLRDGRRADVLGQRRAHHLRRSHKTRPVVPRDVAAVAPSAGPRSLPRRRLLPALAPARARRRSSPTKWAAVR